MKIRVGKFHVIKYVQTGATDVRFTCELTSDVSAYFSPGRKRLCNWTLDTQPGKLFSITKLLHVGLSFFIDIVFFLVTVEHVIARGKENLYYAGKVASIENGVKDVLLENGDNVNHKIQDFAAVIQDKEPLAVHVGQHVLVALDAFEGRKYYIGNVIDKTRSAPHYKVFIDNYNVSRRYNKNRLRILPDHQTVLEGK